MTAPFKLTAILFQVTLFCLLTVTAYAQGYGLPIHIEERIDGIERDFERSIQQRAPDFRLIRSADEIAPVGDSDYVELPLTLYDSDAEVLSRKGSPPLIATTHDRRTGAPIDSCVMPCTIRSPRVPPAMIVFYRYGTKPDFIGAEGYIFFDDTEPHFLRFNEVDHQIRREDCKETFEEKRRTVAHDDAAPCVRVPPEMPFDAEFSGHCDMLFDISATGDPVNVVAEACTEQVFCEPSMEAVQRWIYHPKLVAGNAAERYGVETKVTYQLSNTNGQLLPEPDGELVPCIGIV